MPHTHPLFSRNVATRRRRQWILRRRVPIWAFEKVKLRRAGRNALGSSRSSNNEGTIYISRAELERKRDAILLTPHRSAKNAVVRRHRKKLK